MPAATELCDLPGVKPGSLLRFIGVFLFLIHNDQAQVFKRGKHGGPGAQSNQGISIFPPLPFIQPLSHGKTAVEYRHLPAVPALEQSQHLGR